MTKLIALLMREAPMTMTITRRCLLKVIVSMAGLMFTQKSFAVDPNWTYVYDLAKTPTANNFTQTFSVNPALVTIVNTGNPANRRVEINSSSGDAIFITSIIPSLDSVTGATAEFNLAISGPGDGGFELTFLNRAFGINVFQDKVLLDVCGDAQASGVFIEVATPSNTVDTLWRVTWDGANIRLS